MADLGALYDLLEQSTYYSRPKNLGKGYGVAYSQEAAAVEKYWRAGGARPVVATKFGQFLLDAVDAIRAQEPTPIPPIPPIPPPSSGEFPSRLKVAGGILVDAGGADVGVLKGFNVHCHSATGTAPGGVMPVSAFQAMGALGAKIQRLILHWDSFQPTEGSVNPGALTDLDTTVGYGGDNGMYSVFEIHLNVGRLPAWVPKSGNEAIDFQNHGRLLTETLAARYKDDKRVIGFTTNETPLGITGLLTFHQTTVPWYRDIAPAWPLWVNPTAYGQGTPYPRSGTAANPAAYLALDTHGVGLVTEYHDYLTQCGTTSTDGYQDNGSPDPKWQVPGGSEYNSAVYGDTNTTRMNLNTHCDPWKRFSDAGGGRIAVAVGEWAYHHDFAGQKEHEYARDKIAAFRQHAAASIEIWWNYDTTTDFALNPWAARPGGVWRQSVSDWMTDATPRA